MDRQCGIVVGAHCPDGPQPPTDHPDHLHTPTATPATPANHARQPTTASTITLLANPSSTTTDPTPCRAHPRGAQKALVAGHFVFVFPGGDYDIYRPSRLENVIDFGGQTGYARTAIAAGVPILPVVSIGGQENEIYLSRGTRLLQALGLNKLWYKVTRPTSCRSPAALHDVSKSPSFTRSCETLSTAATVAQFLSWVYATTR